MPFLKPFAVRARLNTYFDGFSGFSFPPFFVFLFVCVVLLIPLDTIIRVLQHLETELEEERYRRKELENRLLYSSNPPENSVDASTCTSPRALLEACTQSSPLASDINDPLNQTPSSHEDSGFDSISVDRVRREVKFWKNMVETIRNQQGPWPMVLSLLYSFSLFFFFPLMYHALVFALLRHYPLFWFSKILLFFNFTPCLQIVFNGVR